MIEKKQNRFRNGALKVHTLETLLNQSKRADVDAN